MKIRKKVCISLGCAVLAALCVIMSCNTGVYISVGEKQRNIHIKVDSAKNIDMYVLGDSLLTKNY